MAPHSQSGGRLYGRRAACLISQDFPYFTYPDDVHSGARSKQAPAGQMSIEVAVTRADVENLQASTPMVAWLATWVVEAGLPLRVVDLAATRNLCNSLLRIASQEKKQVWVPFAGWGAFSAS